MDKYIKPEEIASLFNLLYDSKINYVLLRNIGNELPNKHLKNKDIDLLVNPKSRLELITILKRNHWKQVPHPWDFGKNFVFLYSMDPFLFFKKGDIHLDVHFQLACRSLNNGEWFPLDNLIQKSIWSNKLTVDEVWKYELSNEDKLVHLVSRCIFDKKIFNNGYVREIENVLPYVKREKILVKFKLIFFKFTPILYDMLITKKYDKIIKAYLEYSNY